MEEYLPLTEATYYILLALREPKHGYGIIQEVAELTNDNVTLGPGTLYGAINTLLKKEWIRLYSEDKASRKKKEYLITAEGKAAFYREVERLKHLLKNAERMEDVRCLN